MRLSFDDKRLVTTGKDGSLCIWKVGRTKCVGMGSLLQFGKFQHHYNCNLALFCSRVSENDELDLFR